MLNYIEKHSNYPKTNLEYFLTHLSQSWRTALTDELQEDYLCDLIRFLEFEYEGEKKVYPPKSLIFEALNLTPYEEVKVIILGQDPYHQPGQAHGLAFSVNEGQKIPPSLRNIYKELESDLGIALSRNGCLTHWATQGVLLLNATLTVREGAPLSHQGKGWERFTDAIIRRLIERKDPIIFALWGRWAEKKLSLFSHENRGATNFL